MATESMLVVPREDDDEGPYLDIAMTGTLELTGSRYHYARVVLDLEADRRELKSRCHGFDDYYSVGEDLMCVYVIGVFGRGHSKIGISDKPGSRLEGLQCSNWDWLSIDYAVWVWGGRAKEVEQLALRLARESGIEARGEWLGQNPAASFDFVMDAAKVLGAHVSNRAARIETSRQEMGARRHVLRVHDRQKLRRSLSMDA